MSHQYLIMARVAGSTYYTAQHMQDAFHSTGETSGGEISDDGDGTITVTAGTGLIRATDSDIAELLFTDWAAESGANVNLTDNDLNYVYVEWNSGSPQVVATTTKRTDYNTNIQLGTVYRIGTDLHISNQNHVKVSDHAGLMTRRLLEVVPYARASGGIVSHSGSALAFSVSAATLWQGLTSISITAKDTNASDTFSYWYRDGLGGWTEVTSQTQIDPDKYDDGDGTLGTVNNNQYSAHWVFQGVDDDLYVVYGRGAYTLADAESAGVPDSLPPHFEGHARVYAKIITRGNDSTDFTAIQSAFENGLVAGLPTSHNDLLDLDSDDHTQYALIEEDAGTAAPATTPTRVGSLFIDTTNDDAYMSVGTASSADWKKITP